MSRYLARLRGRGMRAGLGIAPARPRAGSLLVAAVRDPTGSRAAPELTLGAAGDAHERQASALAQKWRGYIEKNWSRKLKAKDYKVDARMHVDIKAYPGLPEQFASPEACPSLPGDQSAHAGIEESNAIQVVDDACSSVVDYRCDWGFAPYGCGRWSRKSAPLIIAHETGHLLGLADRYYDTPSGSQDLPGFERDIRANVWNDAGKTDFQRAWIAAMLFFFTGTRG